MRDLNELWFTHIVEYNKAIKNNEAALYKLTWKDTWSTEKESCRYYVHYTSTREGEENTYMCLQMFRS